MDLPILETSYKRNNVVFCGWFRGCLLLNIIVSRIITIVPFFLFLIFRNMHLFIHKLIDIWRFPTFCLLQTILQWTFVYKFLGGYAFSFLWGYISRSGIVGPSNFMFSVLRSFYTIFQNRWIILHSYQQYIGVTISVPGIHGDCKFRTVIRLSGIFSGVWNRTL
jgi:hypothetical protein